MSADAGGFEPEVVRPPTPLAEKNLLNPEEAAEYLGVTLRTIRHLVAGRRIPYCHVAKYVRFRRTDLDKMIESNMVWPL
jgi:excisionase family DNA binding protein